MASSRTHLSERMPWENYTEKQKDEGLWRGLQSGEYRWFPDHRHYLLEDQDASSKQISPWIETKFTPATVETDKDAHAAR